MDVEGVARIVIHLGLEKENPVSVELIRSIANDVLQNPAFSGFDLENVMKDMEQLELETIHHFAPGVYARELRVPAGSVITGKVHRTEHLNICAVGHLTVVNGDDKKDIKGPYIFTSPPGTKRAAVVHEDTVWITIHATEETDVEKVLDGGVEAFLPEI